MIQIQLPPAPAATSRPADPASSCPASPGSPPAIRQALRHPEAGTLFHLSNGRFSHAFLVLEDGSLGSLHTGAALRRIENRLSRREGRGYSGGVFAGDHEFCHEHILREFPDAGRTDYRRPAYVVTGPDGTGISAFRYHSHRMISGKPALAGLPATYVEDEKEAETLVVSLYDEVLCAWLDLYWTIWRDLDVICRRAVVRLDAGAKAPVQVDALMSASFDLPVGEGRLLSLHGAWSRERQPVLRDLVPGVQGAESCRGASSHAQHPFLALLSPGASESSGEVFGLSLVYSGNFEARTDTDTFGTTRLQTGINRDGFSWHLEPGQEFASPEAVLVWSASGLGGMSRTFHRLYRTRLARGAWRDKGRQVLINTWEASYFGVTEDKVLEIGRGAQGLGVELLVLDDGWFKGRKADNTSLGDWVEDPVKFGKGLDQLASSLGELGLDFGLWVEPEMVSEDSDLFRAHPDWLLQVPGRAQSHARNQYILDLGRPEVQEFILSFMERLLASGRIRYIKWDMNRNMTEVASGLLPSARQGEVFHRYFLGLYRVLETLTQKHADILWESCAGGGGRFDPGLLHYMSQAWASDDTDAVERLKIQYATSLVYPLSCLGSHVSVVPNHQTGRSVPFGFRALTALFGTFGYELDPASLSEAELKAAAWWTGLCKQERDFICAGEFYRLRAPWAGIAGSPGGFPASGSFGDAYMGLRGEGNACAWMVASGDGRRALAAWYLIQNRPNPGFGRLVLQGLDPALDYRVRVVDASIQGFFPPEGRPDWQQVAMVDKANTGLRGGDELMTLGLALGGESWSGIGRGDYQAVLFVVEALGAEGGKE